MADCTESDIKILKSREIQQRDEYPQNVLHVYKKNVDVDMYNTHMLNKLAPSTNQIIIEAEDDTKGQTRNVSISNIPKNVTATGGLPTLLLLAEGAKVMLTVNVDVSDGLSDHLHFSCIHEGHFVDIHLLAEFL